MTSGSKQGKEKKKDVRILAAKINARSYIIAAIITTVVGALVTLALNWNKIIPQALKTEPTGSTEGSKQPKSEPRRSTKGVQQPKTEKAMTAAGTELFKEDFADNSNGWRIFSSGSYYDAYFDEGRYVIDNKNEKISVELIFVEFQRPKNFDLELSAFWRSGVTNSWYGLVLGVDRYTFYRFGVSANCHSMIRITGKDKHERILYQINGAPGSVRKVDEYSSDRLKIEDRGEKISCYVNGVHIGDIINTIIFDQLAIGVMVEDKQMVAFDNLVLTAR